MDEVENELRSREESIYRQHLDGPTQAATPQLQPVVEQTESDMSMTTDGRSRLLNQSHLGAGRTCVTGVMLIPEQDDEDEMIA